MGFVPPPARWIDCQFDLWTATTSCGPSGSGPAVATTTHTTVHSTRTSTTTTIHFGCCWCSHRDRAALLLRRPPLPRGLMHAKKATQTHYACPMSRNHRPVDYRTQTRNSFAEFLMWGMVNWLWGPLRYWWLCRQGFRGEAQTPPNPPCRAVIMPLRSKATASEGPMWAQSPHPKAPYEGKRPHTPPPLLR